MPYAAFQRFSELVRRTWRRELGKEDVWRQIRKVVPEERTMAIITPIDFSQTPLATPYSPFYAKIIDNVFTPNECADLIALASSTGDWSPAGLSAEGPTQTVHTNFRNSDRMLVINDEVSSRIYEKLRPLVDEISEIAPGSRWSCITARPGKAQGPTWKMVRLVVFILDSWLQKNPLILVWNA